MDQAQSFETIFLQAEDALRQGRLSEAKALLHQILKQDPTQPLIHTILAFVLRSEDNLDGALSHYRQAVASRRPDRDPNLRFHINRLVRRMKTRAQLMDLTDREVPHIAPKVMIFGPPASGLPTLAQAIADTLAWPLETCGEVPVHAPELSLERMLHLAEHPVVIAQPSRCTEPNLQILQVFAPKVTFIVRPIADVLHTLGQQIAGGEPWGLLSSDLVPSQAIDYAARRTGPWLIEQYASFVQAQQNQRLDVQFISYEDLITDPLTAAQQICHHAEIPFPSHGAKVWPSSMPLPSVPLDVQLREHMSEHEPHFQALMDGFPGISFAPVASVGRAVEWISSGHAAGPSPA